MAHKCLRKHRLKPLHRRGSQKSINSELPYQLSTFPLVRVPIRTICVSCLVGDKRTFVVVALFSQAFHGWNVMAFLLLADLVGRNEQGRCAFADRGIPIECEFDWRLVAEADEVSLGDAVDAHALANAVAVIIFCIAIEVSAMSILARHRSHVNHDVNEITLIWVGPLIHLDKGTIMKIDVQDFQILAQLTVGLENLTMVVVGHVKETSCLVR